ncbi:MAG: hypothetical protein QNJ97_00315 [Myxococcota bacterium]|nr:hypothetical protein [Myxococcota bacterium]
MFEQPRGFACTLVIAAVMSCFAGCGGGQPAKTEAPKQPPKTSAGPSGPDYQLFGPLNKAQAVAELPLLLNEEGISYIPCFQMVGDLSPQASGMEVLDQVRQNARAVSDAIRNWFVEDVMEGDISSSEASRWQIEIEDVEMVSVPSKKLRFDENQRCVDEDSGAFHDDLRPITALIGSRKLRFKSSLPIGLDRQEEMIRAVGMSNIVLESPDIFVWEPMRDTTGNPIVNEHGEILFKSPEGKFVPETQVPPPEQRVMREWTLTADAPIYFGVQEASEEAIRRETKKKKCNVYLVWGDVTPRYPECDEFSEVGFVASQGKDGSIDIQIKTDNDALSVTAEYKHTAMAQVNDRIILWLKPKKIEEGLLLRVNSLVLNPIPMSGISRSKQKQETYVPTKTNAPIQTATEDFEEASAPAPEKKKEKKKRRKIETDQDAIDAFLEE